MENDELTLAKDSSVTSSSTTRKEKGDSSGKRSKSTHACDLCKKKKVKCNGEFPCARCQKSGLYCAFNQHKQKRISSKLYVNTQEQRLHILAKALDSLYVENIIQPSENHHTAVTNDATNQAFMMPIEKFNTSSTGRPYYARDWTARLDRLPSTFDTMTLLDNEPRKPDAFALPNTTINLDLLSAYFAHVHPYFPMIHKDSFLLDVHNQSPLLLNAMYAVAEQWVHIDLFSSDTGLGQTTPQPPPGLKYYQDAISLVELYTDAPRLSTIQALLLIVKYHELVRRSGFFYRTQFYFDLVVRMCKDLGLPRILPPTCQVHPILAEQRRRVFWIAYVYDLLMSTELGTPAMFSMDECTVELPNLLDDERNSREQHDTVLYFHWMTMVIKSQGTVVQYLRQKYNDETKKQQQNMGDYLHSLHRHMESLGRELQLWKKPARGRVNFLFLAYHFANILLYRSMALDIMDGDIYQYQQMGIEEDYIKTFLLNEAHAIVDIVDMLLKDHTVACLHYSFRGIQQIIHYLTAAWTVQLMYRQVDNDNRVKRMIQQLTPLTPAVELYSMEQQQQSPQHIGYYQHAPAFTQQQNINDPSSPATRLAPTQLSNMETIKNMESKRQSLKPQQLQQQKQHLPSSSSSPSSPISSPSSSSSPLPSHSHSRTGAGPKTSAGNGTDPRTTQHNDSTLFIDTAPSTSLWQQQKQQQHQQSWVQQNMDRQYVSPSQLSSSPTSIPTPEYISATHIRNPYPPVVNTSNLALLYQPSSSSSSSEPMIPTPSLGSLSSASSLSTIASTPVDTSLTHGSLRLRRSHQQLRNTSHRLLSSDPRSSGSAPMHHHPYMSTANTTTATPAILQQQHVSSPRRHTVSSGQSSPSTSSLPSSPLHRMTLADDPWIQAPPMILPSQRQEHQSSVTPPPPPPSSLSPSSSNLLYNDPTTLSDMPPSSIHQYGTEQEDDNGGMENEIYNMAMMDDPLLSKTPAEEEEAMMELLLPAQSDWHHHETTTSTLSIPVTPTSARSSPLPPT
ncbi:fungal-specific transcription factor domain-domain-containing protein [Absidia repens]|uniref:Fungal-specific transcription factor domain-domain-containing protein n=1 Tax=Absidia repens TaxID=90262 RepID=A0A1X2INJ4_9FUNG|nr:fungal-specific transcription factor domain-domain-containing protein [Absidia repens]